MISANRPALLCGIVVGLAQAATPLLFWWLDTATVYGLGLAVPPGRAATRATSADTVRNVLAEAVQARVSATGTVRLREEVRYLIATT